jgi:tetratricopeptide (TPR) repeat protein
MLMIDHPTEQTLAAFVDDRLDSAARLDVTEHLANCGECQEIVMTAVDYQTSDNVTTGWFGGKRRIAAVAAAIAVAAGLSVVFLPSMLRAEIDDVIAATKSVDERPGPGRLAAMSYKKDATNRGVPPTDPLEVDPYTKLHIIRPDLRDAHAQGVATLMLAEGPLDLQDAIRLLEKARKEAPDDDRVANDLAAAHIALGAWTSDRKELERALALSEELWKRKRTAEAAWNRAEALQLLKRDEEALQAWDAYLALDPASPWAREAEREKGNLKE